MKKTSQPKPAPGEFRRPERAAQRASKTKLATLTWEMPIDEAKRARQYAKRVGLTWNEFVQEALEEFAEREEAKGGALKSKPPTTKTAVRALLRKLGSVDGKLDAPEGQVDVFHAYYDRPTGGYLNVTFDEKRQQFFCNQKPISEQDAAMMWVHVETSDNFSGSGMDDGGLIFQIVARLVEGAR